MIHQLIDNALIRLIRFFKKDYNPTIDDSPQNNSINTRHQFVIGFTALAWPIVCILCHLFLDCAPEHILRQNYDSIHYFMPSLSHYFYTSAQVPFVGICFILSAFFVSYMGYNLRDRIVCRIAGACIFLTAICPTGYPFTKCTIPNSNERLLMFIHILVSSLFILCLAYLSYYVFVKTDGKRDQNKGKRNQIYRATGLLMVVTLISMGVIMGLENHLPENNYFMNHYVLIGELICIIAFGAAWLIKSNTLIFTDKTKPSGFNALIK